MIAIVHLLRGDMSSMETWCGHEFGRERREMRASTHPTEVECTRCLVRRIESLEQELLESQRREIRVLDEIEKAIVECPGDEVVAVRSILKAFDDRIARSE